MPDSVQGSGETILVVDDDQIVLRMVGTLLERSNFRVLYASGGHSAMKLAAETKGRIHLLLSDVDMPSMSGPELSNFLRAIRPDMGVMLMSGARGSQDSYAFIQKPFSIPELISPSLGFYSPLGGRSGASSGTGVELSAITPFRMA